MKLTMLKNRNINTVTEDDIYDIDFTDIIHMIKNPMKTCKDYCKYIFPCDFTPPCERKQQYAKTVYFQILDIDNKDCTVDIHTAIEKLKHWQFALHTSSSHTKTHHKFRVYLPLSKAIKAKDFYSKTVQNVFKKLFNWCDASAFRFIGFYAPNETSEDYYYHINDVNNRFDLHHPFLIKQFQEEHKKVKAEEEKMKIFEEDFKKKVKNKKLTYPPQWRLDKFTCQHFDGNRNTTTYYFFKDLIKYFSYCEMQCISCYYDVIVSDRLEEKELKTIYSSAIKNNF